MQHSNSALEGDLLHRLPLFSAMKLLQKMTKVEVVAVQRVQMKVSSLVQTPYFLTRQIGSARGGALHIVVVASKGCCAKLSSLFLSPGF